MEHGCRLQTAGLRFYPMPEQSAGLLMSRRSGAEPEVLLVHPGGPFWANKDAGAWSIPKSFIKQAKIRCSRRNGNLPRKRAPSFRANSLRLDHSNSEAVKSLQLRQLKAISRLPNSRASDRMAAKVETQQSVSGIGSHPALTR